VRHKFLV